MKIIELINELQTEESFLGLKSENPDLIFCAGFVIIDLENNTKKIQLDFFLPSKKRISGFEYPFSEYKIFEDEINGMDEQTMEIGIDIDDVERLAKEIIQKNQSKLVPNKIIAILKNNEWNITAMDKTLGIARIKINAKTAQELSFEKGSLMDFMGIRKNRF